VIRALDRYGPADQAGAAAGAGPASGRLEAAALSQAEAQAYAASFTAPGSALSTSEFVSDVLATDGAARTGLLASIGAGRFADQVAIAAGLRQPLAILHGAGDQFVRLDYLRALTVPALWRGEIQLISDAGHAPHQETPEQFTALLTDFAGDLDP
jgi:pimeloyl-ACP methyl ester carboxylesterase